MGKSLTLRRGVWKMFDGIKLVLASGSPRRKEILERHDVSFEVIKSTCEEITHETEPDKVVMDLAMQKAKDVAAHLKGKGACLVLAADTVVAANGEILGKPSDEKDAERMLLMLQDNAHQVYTGVALLSVDMEPIEVTFAECTDVLVYPMAREEIWSYILTKEPMDKAGAYGIQGRFAVYIKGIRGDYDNVVGLPIARLYQETKNLTLLKCGGD